MTVIHPSTYKLAEYGTNDPSAQADFPAHAFDALSAPPPGITVPAVLWFCWSDAMVPPFGLVDTAGAPKPSYSSFSNWTHTHVSGLHNY